MAWPTLARTAGRHANGRFYDDIARLATAGDCDADGLLAAARRGEAPRHVDVRGLAWFAHVTASRGENPTRFADVAALFDLGYRLGRRKVFLPQLDDVWLQSAFLAGRLDELTEHLSRGRARPVTWWSVRTDAAHPGTVTGQARDWLSMLNLPYVECDLEPITVVDGEGAPFDRVQCVAPRVERADAVLVSVVVPVYNPGPSLRTAVRSLTAQTWPHLEVLLVDDASSQGLDIIEELAAEDSRIRVVRAPRNAGAYAARNLGMGLARGELVTFNDADDWAHPRKIERQVEAMAAAPEARGSMSWSIRVTEDLRLTVIGRDTRRINLSSVMVRRADVLERLGGFDGVRKGADSEFVSRFTRVFGGGSLVEVTDPLSLVQLTSGSLSRDDYQFLRTHPARTQYVAAFRSWHEAITDIEDAFVPPGVRAPFPAPAMIAGGPRTPVEVDVLLLANLGAAAPSVPSLADEVLSLAEAGLSVGVREYLSPFDVTASVRPPSGALAKVLRTQDAVQLPPGDRAAAGLVVVRDPGAVAAMPPEHLATISARAVLVVADYAPEGGRYYDAAEVTRTLGSALGTDVRWLPATGRIARQLVAEGAASVLAPSLFAALPQGALVPRARTARPRVALYPGETDGLSVSDLDRQVAALAPEVDVELVGLGAGRLQGSLGDRFSVVARPEHLSTDDLLTSVDVLVVGPSRGRGAHTQRLAAHAMRHGCAVVASPEFRDHFGDAALYLDERDVTQWVNELLEVPGLLEELGRRGRQLVARAMSPQRLVATVLDVLDGTTEGRAA